MSDIANISDTYSDILIFFLFPHWYNRCDTGKSRDPWICGVYSERFFRIRRCLPDIDLQ